MINWKLRLKNKNTLISLITVIIAFIYQILAIVGVTVPITQDQVLQVATLIITVLAAYGIVIDPTTQGVSDSNEALERVEPK